MKSPLSEEQIEHFHREGYLVVEGLLDEADLNPVIGELSQEIDRRARQLVEDGVLSRDYAEYDFEHRLAKISDETDALALAIWNGRLHLPAMFGLITNPKLLDVAEALCGEELIASSVYRLRPKIPRHNHGPVPWHQDSGYFEPYCDKSLVLTMWVPLVDATPERGCLWALPRAHRGDVLPHRFRDGKPYLEIPGEALPQGVEPVCCPVPKGGVLLLTNRTPHVSFENTTDIVRWSMDLRYQSAALPTNAAITRLPGEATPRGQAAADADFVPVACYPPEADFLVRSRRRPNEVTTTAEAFARLREQHQTAPVTDRWRQLERA